MVTDPPCDNSTHLQNTTLCILTLPFFDNQCTIGRIVSVWYTLSFVPHKNCLPYAVFFGILLGLTYFLRGGMT